MTPIHALKRVYYKSKNVEAGVYVAAPDDAICPRSEANLISSRLIDSNLHAPVIDFDLPIEVYPSTQLGHNHLYINQPINWTQFRAILWSLKCAGLVEAGYYNACLARGYAAVRPPGVQKPGVTDHAEMTKQNALLRQENYMLKEILAQKEAEIAALQPNVFANAF